MLVGLAYGQAGAWQGVKADLDTMWISRIGNSVYCVWGHGPVCLRFQNQMHLRPSSTRSRANQY